MVKVWKKVWQTNGTEKKNGIAILISGRIDFKWKQVRRDREGFIKRKIHQQDITIQNICAKNMGKPNFINEALLNTKLQIDSNTLIVGDFNTLLTNRQIILGEKT